MKKLKSFEQFISESHVESVIEHYAKNVAWILQISDITSTAGNRINDKERAYNEDARETLFNYYSTKEQFDNDKVVVPLGMPILYYGGGSDEESEMFLKNKAVDKRYLYNQRNLLLLSGDKTKFAELFGKFDWLPKTVFSKEEALKGAVGFPVIAKVKSGHSGVGIEKFDTAKDLEKSKKEFDLFCQFIDFDREYRVGFCRDQIFFMNERVPREEDNLSIRTKKADDHISFAYVYQDLNKVDAKFIQDVKSICDDIKTELDLDLWSLDVVLDKDGKAWVMETSSATGLGSTKMTEVYRAIYEDFYQEELPNAFLNEIYKRFVVKGHQNYWPKLKKEILSSPWAMDYTIITDPTYENGYRYFYNLDNDEIRKNINDKKVKVDKANYNVKIYEEFVKSYDQKITPEEFANIPEGSEVLYRGLKQTVVKNNKTTIEIVPMKGKKTLVNLSMFNEFGAITK